MRFLSKSSVRFFSGDSRRFGSGYLCFLIGESLRLLGDSFRPLSGEFRRLLGDSLRLLPGESLRFLIGDSRRNGFFWYRSVDLLELSFFSSSESLDELRFFLFLLTILSNSLVNVLNFFSIKFVSSSESFLESLMLLYFSKRSLSRSSDPLEDEELLDRDFRFFFDFLELSFAFWSRSLCKRKSWIDHGSMVLTIIDSIYLFLFQQPVKFFELDGIFQNLAARLHLFLFDRHERIFHLLPQYVNLLSIFMCIFFP